MTYMHRTTVHLTDQQRERLKQMCSETELQQAEIIRRAIDEYVEKWLDKRQIKDDINLSKP